MGQVGHAGRAYGMGAGPRSPPLTRSGLRSPHGKAGRVRGAASDNGVSIVDRNMDATSRPGMARLKTTHALMIAAGLMLHVTFAAGASDSVAITVDGRLKIESVVDAPSGCYAAGQATIGPPPGQIPVQDAVVVTYPLVYNRRPEQLCAQFILSLI